MGYFRNIFTIGSVHKCTIISKNDKGATLELPYGIEGYALLKHLAKADGTVAEAGEKLPFQVLGVPQRREENHAFSSKTWEAPKEEEKKEAKKKGGKENTSQLLPLLS